MNTEPVATENNPEWLSIVAEQLRALRFGVIQIVVHEHRVVQVEKTEKWRFDQTGQPR